MCSDLTSTHRVRLRFMIVKQCFQWLTRIKTPGNQSHSFSTASLPARALTAQGQRSKACLRQPKQCSSVVSSISHTHTHRKRRAENIPQQRSVGRHEHPEETTVTSCQIKPSWRLLVVITAAADWLLSGWGTAPPSRPLPPITFVPTPTHQTTSVTNPLTSRTVGQQRWVSPCSWVRMGLLILLTSTLLSACKTLWIYFVWKLIDIFVSNMVLCFCSLFCSKTSIQAEWWTHRHVSIINLLISWFPLYCPFQSLYT